MYSMSSFLTYPAYCQSPTLKVNKYPGTDISNYNNINNLQLQCPELGDNSMNLKNILKDDYNEIINRSIKTPDKIETSIFIDKDNIIIDDSNGSISDYNNLILKTNNPNEPWLKSPSIDILSKDIYPIYGHEIPEINTKKAFHVYNNGPSLDGTYDTPNSMAMFSHNICSPLCCPSELSCNGGCVCTTSNQRKFIKSGGIRLN